APLQKPSNDPPLPYPTGPNLDKRMWPTSPAVSLVPAYRCLAIFSPAPCHVPNDMNSLFREPRSAPHFHSASAQAFASFCKPARTPIRCSTMDTIGIPSQPGRLGGDMISPLFVSSGPPQLMPIAPTCACVNPCFAIMPSTAEQIADTVSSTPAVGNRSSSTNVIPASL